MKLTRYIFAFIILLTVGILYDRYKKKYEPQEDLKKYDLIQKYLLNETTDLGKKPVMWVYTDHEINSRNWESFSSRNNKKLNQPYINVCIETIIKQCSESFNVCLIDNNSFSKLIPNWNIRLHNLAEPIKSNIVKLGLFKLLYYYGGVLVPNSCIFLRDFIDLHNSLIKKGFYVGEMVARNNISDKSRFFISNKILGANKNNQAIGQLIQDLEICISNNNTDSINFEGKIDKYIYKLMKENRCNIISGEMLGTKTTDHKVVLVDDLLANLPLKLNPNLYLLYLPADEILRRTKFQWFARLSKRQLFQSNTIAGKHLLLAYGKKI